MIVADHDGHREPFWQGLADFFACEEQPVHAEGMAVEESSLRPSHAWRTQSHEWTGGGFEPPTHGFSVRCPKNVSPAIASTSQTSKPQWTPQLTPENQKQGHIDTSTLSPDSAEIAAIWPQLPDHVKVAIKALVQVYKESE